MWPFLHPILLRFIHGLTAGIEVALRIIDPGSRTNVSESSLIPENGVNWIAHHVWDSMALCVHRSRLATSGIHDFFFKCTFPFLSSINDPCTPRALTICFENVESGAAEYPDWWFWSPLIRGQLNDFTRNASDPRFLACRGCDCGRVLQAS
jgi:hypothetical protein